MPNEPAPGPEGGRDADSAVQEEEKRETLQEIEDLVRAGHRPIGAGGKPSRAGSSGAALPAIVVASALVLIAAASLILPRLYDLDEKRAVASAAAGPAGGSELFKALREETGQEIQEREQALGELRTQYDRARTEREALRSEFDSRLSERARQLEAGVAAELEKERSRLTASGLADAAVAERLEAFRKQQELDRQAELQAFQARLEAETAERDRQLADAAARYNEELKRSTDPLKAEIERLASESRGSAAAQRELSRRYDEAVAATAQLKKEYEDKIAALERRLRDADSRTARLQASEDRRSEARKRLDDLLRTARGSAPAAAGGAGRQELLDLLEAKTEVRALLAQEPAKSSKPGLGERMDRYFEIFEGEYREQGRKQGLAQAAETSDALAAGRTLRNPPRGDGDFAAFLEKLQTLLR